MGGKKATSTSTVSIPPEVLARYNAVNARAETAASKPFQAFGNTASDYVAQMNAQQGLGTSTINASGGPASAGIDRYMSPYIKNVADTTGAYMRQQQEQAQSGALGRAASSGAFGGDRAGIAAANLQQQNGMAYGKTMADIMNQGYTQALGASQADLNRGLQAGQMQLAAGTMQQQTEQAGKDAMINRFMQEQGLPYQQAQFLANIALGTGAASGSTTTSTQPIGFFGNLATGGKVEGYAEGGGVAGPVSHSKEAIGGVGYVPEPNLPIGDLMIAQPPQQSQDSSGDKIAQILAMIGGGGKKDGGGVAGSYADGGDVRPVSFMNSREGRMLAAAPRALLEALNMVSADGHAARAEKPADEEMIRRLNSTNYNMNNFYNQAESMKQDLDKNVLGPIASGYNSMASGASSRLADLFGTLGDDMVQKTYQDLARESADKALRYSNEGIFSPKAATPSEIEDRQKLAHLTRYADGGVAGGRHGYATDGVVLTPQQSEEQRMRDALRQSLGGVYGNTDDIRQPSPLARGEIPAAQTLGSLPDAKVEMANAVPVGGVDAILARSQTGPQIGPSGALGLNLPADATIARPGDYKAESMRRFLDEAPKGGVVPTAAQQPKPRPAGLGVAAATEPAEVGATGVAAPVTTRQIAKVLGAGKGYTDVEYSDGTRDRVTGNLNFRNNNPGNIEFGNLAQKYGAVGTDGRFAVFPDYETGRKAQEALLFESGVYSGKTIGSAIAKYAPAGDGSNDPAAYANNVAAALGVSVDTPLSALNPEQRSAMISAMEKVEGGGGGSSSFSTTPLGDNGAPIPLQAGAPTGGVKPYEDRNAVGKFFHNPQGGLDRNAVLSLLSGLGTMASSRSISPFTAILQGLGAGSDTYKDLLKQSAEVASTNIANMRNIQMDTMTYNELNDTNLTPQQYSSMVGLNYQIPTGTAQSVGGDKMTFNEYQNGVVDIDGRTVNMQDDPVSIQKFISDNSMFPPDSPIGQQVVAARTHLNDINNSGGMTVDKKGQQFQISGYTKVGDVQAKTVSDQAAAADFRKAAGEAINSSAQQLAAVSTLESVYTKMEPGKFANVGAEASAILSALDPNNITGWSKYDLTDPTQYQIAMKGAGEIMATRLRTMPGGAPSAEIDMLSTITPTPNMQSGAVKKLLAIAKADAKYRLDMYNNYDPAVHGNDVNAYMKQFADSGKTFTRYVEEAMASMPRFAGEGIEPSAAEAELIKRGYVRNSEGKLVKP